MMQTSLIDELLDNRSYHIEFNGHLTNHVKHAVVVLAGLGVAPHDIKAYHDRYARRTSYGYGLEPARSPHETITVANWMTFLGRRVHFSAYCDFFDQEVQKAGLKATLACYLPQLIDGWVGAFTHATIHLGLALDAGNHRMAIEGLAYLAFSHMSCHPERDMPPYCRIRGEASAADSLLRIARCWESDDGGLRSWAEALIGGAAEPTLTLHPELVRSGLQYRIASLLTHGHPVFYQAPTWINAVDLAAIWSQLYYACTLLYLAKPGDFVLLHLVTSLYAMERIAEHLPEHQQRWLLRCFWIGMHGIALSEASFPSHQKISELNRVFAGAADAGAAAIWRQDWMQIVVRAVQEDEEHNPKLVYVLRQVWDRTGALSIYRAAAAQFTATPALPPSFDRDPTV
jgi:hypothetical protein